MAKRNKTKKRKPKYSLEKSKKRMISKKKSDNQFRKQIRHFLEDMLMTIVKHLMRTTNRTQSEV